MDKERRVLVIDITLITGDIVGDMEGDVSRQELISHPLSCHGGVVCVCVCMR